MYHFQIDSHILNQWQRYAKVNFAALCQSRPAESHKGTFGTVGILGGQQGMSGAIILAGSAALKYGLALISQIYRWLSFPISQS